MELRTEYSLREKHGGRLRHCRSSASIEGGDLASCDAGAPQRLLLDDLADVSQARRGYKFRLVITYNTVFVIDLASRRLQILGSTHHPEALFMQQARADTDDG